MWLFLFPGGKRGFLEGAVFSRTPKEKSAIASFDHQRRM
jgi:hypothetical protein